MPVPVDLIKLSDVVKNNVVKKAVYDKLAAKVNNNDTSEFVLKTKYQTDKTELEKKIPDVTNFLKKTKLTELENNIPDITGLAIKAALTAVEFSSLVEKEIMTHKLVTSKRNLLIIIIKDLFGILVIVSSFVINHVTLVNI